MRKDEIKIGQCYRAKVSDRVVTVRIDSMNSHGGWNATNTATGKRIRIKSAQRLRCNAKVARAAKAALAKRKAAVVPDEPSPADAPRPEINPTVEIVTGQPLPEAASGPVATKSAAKRRAKQPAEPRPKRVSALDAAAQVLQDAGQPMRTKELIVAMATRGLWSSPNGKTPEATLYAAILREITTKGDGARFRKVERGQFEFSGAAAAGA